MTNKKNTKYRDLFLGLLFDAVGMLSFSVLGIGEFSDVIWAPLSFWLMTRMYKGAAGKAAGMASFVEELIPGTDFIPSFTIMWFYTYVISGSKLGEVLEKK
ncbi:hypothetical protein [Cellulophaga omnivescoria]|uniref:hypothetical protein n=1 Tax=Cellulophaga omnivescoria TaxID=1888890 RepID=UPI00098790B0|nr:hypothetical protein [Cellulophaga omnivescoria]WBU89177.1 hypothetical protein PBN93_15045 [Cellulophaga omnivescoria]WKB81172.1 hypothetical protein QYR09_15635 [Cellulophaga lytica]